jgi:hypothetical protein
MNRLAATLATIVLSCLFLAAAAANAEEPAVTKTTKATDTTTATTASKQPIRLHPDNPHYFLFRGKPTVLIGSTEHYGAVLNLEFDNRKYLAAIQPLGFNLTRTFSGVYCEATGNFGIQHNTLAPAKDKLICPWARSDQGGYPNGGNKFDLAKWDEAYFSRLRDFVGEASRRGVVVEFVLFCPFYEDPMWALSPMNAVNNVNDVGHMKRTDVYTLADTADNKKLLAIQDAVVRKIVAELKDFDNLYYEICNEPYFGGVTIPWQEHIAATIAEAEKDSPATARHLIAQNIANGSQKVAKANPLVSILNFHYATPPTTVAENFGLNLALSDDETGFKGSDDNPYRMEGWDFFLAGGAAYDNLDYTFTVGHEDGTCKNNAPGACNPELHKQLGIMGKFINGFDFVKMSPAPAVVKGGVPDKATVHVLAEAGKQYAVYLRGGKAAELVLDLPAGTYNAEWVNTRTGAVDKAEDLRHEGGQRKLACPEYKDDVALRVVAGPAGK